MGNVGVGNGGQASVCVKIGKQRNKGLHQKHKKTTDSCYCLANEGT
jgi:hypothetical protein